VLDLTAETPLPLAAAAKRIPPGRSGKKTHISTLVRWIKEGAKSPTGEVVRLEAARLGSRWVTSLEALQRFSQALTPAGSDAPTAAPRTPGQRRRASEAAARELEKAGIK
jgi:hypothetical protein